MDGPGSRRLNVGDEAMTPLLILEIDESCHYYIVQSAAFSKQQGITGFHDCPTLTFISVNKSDK